jgi:hypothetical protein
MLGFQRERESLILGAKGGTVGRDCVWPGSGGEGDEFS